MGKIYKYTRVRNGKTQIVKAERGIEQRGTCKECGKPFLIKGNKKQKFCNRKCYQEDWKRRIPGMNKGKKGLQIAWNKGLTAETNDAVKRNTDASTRTIREKFRTGELKPYTHTPEINKKIGRAIGRMPNTETKLEKVFWKHLENLGIVFEKNYHIDHNIRPDAYVKESKICIYADGRYWHSLQKAKVCDMRVNKWLRENGYIVIRFAEEEILARDFPIKLKLKLKI